MNDNAGEGWWVEKVRLGLECMRVLLLRWGRMTSMWDFFQSSGLEDSDTQSCRERRRRGGGGWKRRENLQENNTWPAANALLFQRIGQWWMGALSLFSFGITPCPPVFLSHTERHKDKGWRGSRLQPLLFWQTDFLLHAAETPIDTTQLHPHRNTQTAHSHLTSTCGARGMRSLRPNFHQINRNLWNLWCRNF